MWLQMQADRNLDGNDAVVSVEQMLNEFAQRQRDAIKAYEAWRVRQQLKTSSAAHLDQLKQHAAEVSVYLLITLVELCLLFLQFSQLC